MHEQPTEAATNAAQDRRDQGAVLAHIIDVHPTSLRLLDLILELADDPADFAERDRIERATRDLVRVGLLFRCEDVVLPTRAALNFYRMELP